MRPLHTILCDRSRMVYRIRLAAMKTTVHSTMASLPVCAFNYFSLPSKPVPSRKQKYLRFKSRGIKGRLFIEDILCTRILPFVGASITCSILGKFTCFLSSVLLFSTWIQLNFSLLFCIAYDQDKGNLYLIVDGGRKCCIVWLDNLKVFIERALRHYVLELQSVKFILTW